jgi:endonuclease/exonuclease/phosphatase family metal-dependent hydrolase
VARAAPQEVDMRRSRPILAVLAAALSACGSSTPKPAPTPPGPGPDMLKVMTQNLYLGADLDLLLSAGADLSATVELLWTSMLATDFPARAKVVADAVRAADPDVIALQEVSLWRYQQPGDHLPYPNATTVRVDFLDVLVRELDARGLAYDVASTATNADLELPGSSGTDYRLTDRDVLLTRRTLPVTATASGTYTHLGSLPVTTPFGPTTVQIKRGWASADVRAGGKTVRVFDTHLEAFSADAATQQVGDLLAVTASTPGPTVIAGDMNLPPGSTGYEEFLGTTTRLSDAWSSVHGADPGLTCCWSPDLRGGTLGTRIDLVFATPELRPVAAARLEDGARTPGGLSPSDHLGVLATLDATSATSTAAAAAPLAAADR